MFAPTLVANGQPPITAEPGDGALDLPAIPTQPVIAFYPTAGDAWDDAALTQPAAMDVVVVTLVRSEPARLSAARSAPRLDRRDRVDHRLQQGAVMGVCSGNVHDQRNSIRIGQHVDLRSLLATVDRARAGQ